MQPACGRKEVDVTTKFAGVRHAVLAVRDPQRSIEFYTDALGMELVSYLEDMQMAFLSFGARDHDLAVMKVPDDEPVGSSGLSHTAIEVAGGQDQLQELYATLRTRGVDVELTADHVLTKSFYLLDPDGNRLEFYVQALPAPEAKRYLTDARVADDVFRPLDLAGPAG
jgi:catechol 2,3-dioxygenase